MKNNDNKVIHAFETPIEKFIPPHSTPYEDTQLKRALSALCGLQDDLNCRRRTEIFANTILAKGCSEAEKISGLHEVSSRDKISRINQKLGYTRAIIGLLKNFHEDALFPSEQDLEGISDELGFSDEGGEGNFYD